MAENYISQFWSWTTGDTITASRLNGNITNLTDGLSGGVKSANIGKLLLNGVEVINSSRVGTFTNAVIDNIDINLNTISTTSGNLNLTPVSGSSIVIDSHFGFDGTTLTALTNSDTTFTAYASKNITIEGVTFDGGIATIPTLLIGTTTNTPSVDMYLVTANGVGAAIKTHANDVGLSFIDQYDTTEYFSIMQKNQGGSGQSAVDLTLKSAGTSKIKLSSQPSSTSYFNASSGIYIFGATSAAFSSKVEITGNTYITGNLNIGHVGGYDNKLIVYDEGTDGTVVYPIKIYSGKTGGGVTSSGMGVGLEFQWIQANGNPYVGARIAGVSHDASAGRGDLSIYTRYDASTVNELMRFSWGTQIYSYYYFEAQVTAGSNNIEAIPFSVKTTYSGSSAVGLATGIGFQVLGLNGNHYQIAKITADLQGVATGNLNFYTMNDAVSARAGYFDYNGDFYLGYNLSVAGTLSATGNFAINTNKFTVTASSGNTVVAGTLSATGDFAINTNKLTVAASTGNTLIAGTLGVTGNATFSHVISGSAAISGTATVGNNLTVSGYVKVTAQPRCYLTRSTAQAISDSSVTAIEFDQESFDDTGMHSTSSNTDRITIATAGTYLITASLSFEANTTGDRSTILYLGALAIASQTQKATTLNCDVTASCIFQCAAGEILRVKAYQTSGGSLNVLANASSVSVAMLS